MKMALNIRTIDLCTMLVWLENQPLERVWGRHSEGPP